MSAVNCATRVILVTIVALSTIAFGQPSASSDLDAIVDALLAGSGRGAATAAAPATAPSPDDLLSRLRALDAARLSPDENIDRRFAETILVGRKLTRARTSGVPAPMGAADYTTLLRQQYLFPYDADGLWS